MTTTTTTATLFTIYLLLRMALTYIIILCFQHIAYNTYEHHMIHVIIIFCIHHSLTHHHFQCCFHLSFQYPMFSLFWFYFLFDFILQNVEFYSSFSFIRSLSTISLAIFLLSSLVLSNCKIKMCCRCGAERLARYYWNANTFH